MIDFFLHIDKHLATLITLYGHWIYAILFLIIFCETGLIVTPFLPGDSLLFAAGTLAGSHALNVHVLAGLLIIAAILGDGVNYWVGHHLGRHLYRMNNRFIKKEYFDYTQQFYDRHGGKTIIIARFIPIIRTFAPCVAGVGRMPYSKFFLYNVTGALAWVGLLLYAGYFFGTLPLVKNNFTLVILGIIVLSILPALFHYVQHRLKT